jgi:hypothetical protein
LKIFLVIPAVFISFAARIKRGTASKTKLLRAVIIFWAITEKVTVPELERYPRKPAMPREKATGTPTSITATKPKVKK